MYMHVHVYIHIDTYTYMCTYINLIGKDFFTSPPQVKH